MPKTQSQDELIPLLIDTKSGKPGCVILQALWGPGSFHPDLPLSITAAEHWLVSPTDSMQVVVATKKEWAEYGQLLDEKYLGRKA